MKTSDRLLARRYARAFYQSAAPSGAAEAACAELRAAAEALAGREGEFSHPRVGVPAKKELLRQVLGKTVSAPTLRFLDLLVEKKRFGLLPQAAACLEDLCDEGRGVAHAAVRAAAPLSEEEVGRLGRKLGAFAGKTMVLDVQTDPELLGGVVVRLGDWVFDASLRGRLRRLQGILAG
ncbi:MAG: ATP synthase F1 subunit delta [Elusimicrobia bacterium GWA2_69_24]|nr:MAG: ATP synthase F1 subunit delta [Elusimicrobia bacterium GWA2_69_24]HBL18063.1 ATP synthase F1 subunit delta [Elusimicrobiota bacterium]